VIAYWQVTVRSAGPLPGMVAPMNDDSSSSSSGEGTNVRSSGVIRLSERSRAALIVGSP
jgi:hypothetical protein